MYVIIDQHMIKIKNDNICTECPVDRIQCTNGLCSACPAPNYNFCQDRLPNTICPESIDKCDTDVLI